MRKLTREAKEFIDAELRSAKAINYQKLAQALQRKYGISLSKAGISRRAKALKIEFRPGRKRLTSVGKRPDHSVSLHCAGAFFLKGAELELGLLAAINRLLSANADSPQAHKALQLAQTINALLLYASVFGLKTPEVLVGYRQKGLLYLSGQKTFPHQAELEQYLHFLRENKLLPFIIKEVIKICQEALLVRIESDKQVFYLDAQGRTVWPDVRVPAGFTATLSKANGYIKELFQFPSPKRPLILQTCPGYTFLAPEMFNLIRCFQQASRMPFSRIVIATKSGEVLSAWENVKPAQKCYFLAALGPWQYANLRDTKIVKDFRQYLIGPGREPMQVADAWVNLFNPQLNENIRVRAILVRKNTERLALITNISPKEERYARRLAEQYFSRWPQTKLKTYYDLLEEAHAEQFSRARSYVTITPFITIGYEQNPIAGFRLILEHLHRYAQKHFFSPQYAVETFPALREKFYQQEGFLKIKRASVEVILRPFAQKELHKAAQEACQRLNQSAITFPDQRRLLISVQ